MQKLKCAFGRQYFITFCLNVTKADIFYIVSNYNLKINVPNFSIIFIINAMYYTHKQIL